MISKGSEWKQWDLHFHTQSSYDYGDKSVTNQEIIDEMKRNEISVFAMTDHHFIDIQRYRELSKLGDAVGIKVLPGIEFLSDAKGPSPIHFIAIFSDSSDIEYIWGQLENRTAISRVRGEGKSLNEVYCDLEDTIKLVKDLNGVVTIHAGKKSNSIENITNSLPHGVAQKMDTANLIDIFELGKETDQDDYRKFVFRAIGKPIPMIICSDNHNINNYVRKQKLWIKGSADFDGLKYALNEPECRFFIGEEPSVIRRVRENKTKYIRSLNIKRTGKHDNTNEWFEDIQVPLNNELVTIIGHKGSGKSALSDIIAMCSDAEHSADYLFLHKDKFKKKGLADRFSASLEFESGRVTEERKLIHPIDETQERLIRYLPQSYFEKVCNEIGKVEAFRAEIEKVVFQYVPFHKRLSQPSFRELIDFKKESVDKEINHLYEEISDLNDKIIRLEDLSDPEFRKRLISKKKLKEEELSVHNSLLPVEVSDPSNKVDTPDNIRVKAELKGWEDQKLKFETELGIVDKSVSEKNVLLEEVQQLKRDLKSKAEELFLSIKNGEPIASKCGFDINNVIKVEFNEELFDSHIDTINEANNIESKKLILEDDVSSKAIETLTLASKVERCKTEILKIQSKFTGEQKSYQDYLLALKEWSEQKSEIEGNVDTPDSLAYITGKLNYIDLELSNDLMRLREERINKSLAIFSKKSEIKSFYDDIKHEIDAKLSESDVSGLSIVSSFYPSSDFKQSLLRNIMQNRTGSFYGSDDGATLLNEELILPTDWNQEESISLFLSNIISYLEEDKRGCQNGQVKIFIGSVTKNRKELYRDIFGLNYISPHYDLQQRGKSLEQLSPGEKGALLLVFYLVLDKEDIPLIIDQPEDNLDNNSVVKVLVPYIKEAKQQRQIIMVTHNPNLAVVSDSEQVIKVQIDKENGNKFSFVSGGIETCTINEQIVEVLEGTIPAFTLRKDKYQIV